MDYKSCVLYVYHQKKKTNSLSLRLLNPSPGELRDECLAVCSERFEEKDKNVLRTFFGRGEDKASYIRLIDNHDIDKFRPLERHLKGQTRTCNHTNIELLAWLIDFKWRPYDFGVDYSKLYVEIEKSSLAVENAIIREDLQIIQPRETKTLTVGFGLEQNEQREGFAFKDEPNEKKNELDNTLDKKEIETPDTRNEHMKDEPVIKVKPVFSIPDWIKIFEFDKISSKFRSRKAVILTALIACSSALIILLVNKTEIVSDLGKQKWMYWTGDQYQVVSDSRKTPNTSVIAFDQKIMDNFRKITRIDTISERSINVVYCSKKDNVYEYFTSNGRHPIDPFRTLRPLSRYVWERYIRPQAQSLPGPK